MLPTPAPVSRPNSITSLRNWPWRPILACGGALVVGGILSPLALQTPSTTQTTGEASQWQIAMPITSTMVVRPMPSLGRAVKGEIRLVADAVGKAPTGGAVARWVIEPGTHVEKGQPVVEISSGQSTRVAPRAEAAQSAAEKQQIDASNAQLALAQQLATSQIKLRAAQERVDSAQARVGEAREIIQKLQRGEEVRLPGSKALTPEPTPAVSTKEQKAAKEAADTASAAREAAKKVATLASEAKANLDAADKTLREAKAQLKTAEKAQEKAEDLFDAGRAVGSEVQDARSAAADAKAAVQRATDEVATARKAATTVADEATKADALAKNADQEAQKLAKNAELSPPPEPTVNAGDSLNLDQASRLVTEALSESRRATREAERLNAQVQEYQRQVRSSQNRIENASEDLKTAQQQVLDSVPPPRFSTATAAADGIVVWISRLAREVQAGDGVFGLSHSRHYRAAIEDSSQSWKHVRVGQSLPALLVLPKDSNGNGSAPNEHSRSTQTQETGDNATSSAPVSSTSIPTNITVTQVSAPESDGEAATIEGEVASSSGTQIQPGMQILVSLPGASTSKPSKATIAVPTSAVVEHEGSRYIATLEAAKVDPYATPEPTPPSNSKASHRTPSSEDSDAALETSSTQAAQTSQRPLVYQLHWREVKVGSTDVLSLQQVIKAGLNSGERIITDPQPLLAQVSPETDDATLIRLSLD